MQVAPHPHTGLQTVSWLLDGAIRHRDTLGSDVLLRPGALGLMTAGRGIAHSERSPADRPRLLHGVQLWVALPEAARDGDPAFALHDDDLATLAARRRVGTRVRRLARRRDVTGRDPHAAARRRGAAGPRRRRSRCRCRPRHEHALVVVEGTVTVDATPVAAGRAGLPRHRPRDRSTCRRPTAGSALLLGGEPFERGAGHVVELPRPQPGRDRGLPPGLERRRHRRRGLFGPVEGADSDRMLAPPLPGVPLKPRGRTG